MLSEKKIQDIPRKGFIVFASRVHLLFTKNLVYRKTYSSLSDTDNQMDNWKYFISSESFNYLNAVQFFMFLLKSAKWPSEHHVLSCRKGKHLLPNVH